MVSTHHLQRLSTHLGPEAQSGAGELEAGCEVHGGLVEAGFRYVSNSFLRVFEARRIFAERIPPRGTLVNGPVRLCV